MRKLAYLIIVIAIILIAFPFVFKGQTLFNHKNKKEESNNNVEYNYISYNDLSENNKTKILSKLYSKTGPSETCKLNINNQTYTLYEIFSPNEIYKIKINQEKKLLTSSLNKFKDIDFYLINSMNNIIKLNFCYTKDNIPTYKESDIIKKDGWTFYYDSKELTMFGYYQSENGYFRIKIGDGNLNNNKNIQEDFINLIINNIMITKDTSNSELYKNSYNNTVTSYIELSKEDSIYELDKDNIVDLGTNFYITKWSISDNWLSNEIDLVSRDYSNNLSIRESIKDYNIDTIKNVLSGNNIESIDYKNNIVYIIYETNTDRLQGYIKKVNNRSYTILYNLNKSNILNAINNDKNMFVEYTEKNLYKNGG